MNAAHAFGTLPTLAWCLVILVTAGLLGYGQLIRALDAWVLDAEPEWEQSWPCPEDCAQCDWDVEDVA